VSDKWRSKKREKRWSLSCKYLAGRGAGDHV